MVQGAQQRCSRGKIWRGAAVWGLGVPLLLACLCSMSFWSSQVWPARFAGYLMFFGMTTGPFALLGGMGAANLADQWRQKNLSRSRILWRCALSGAGLCALVEWASIGFLYSFGAIAAHAGVLGWLRAFWPWGIGYLPLALIIGAICGAITAWLV